MTTDHGPEQRPAMLVLLGKGARPGHSVYKCECGVEKEIRRSHVKEGRVVSCGCLNRKKSAERLLTHGMANTAEYKTWVRIINRCTNPKSPDYGRYGGRGIKVCDKWRQSFTSFLDDMGPKPSPSHSIDRIDNSGDYEPGNCRWATNHVQSRNKRNNISITYQGETKTLTDWAESLGIPRHTLSARLQKYGMSAEVAFTTPVKMWARMRCDACTECGTTETPHAALGLCKKCYRRKRKKEKPT